MLGLSREHEAGGVFEEQESDVIKFLPVQGEGDIAKSRLCSKAARDFVSGHNLK